MAHDFGVVPTFLSITPTRDNVTAPGARLADKHTRMFCGKTLDEWTMMQLWSSKYLGHAVFVCETVDHLNRLLPMAQRYGVELLVRPREMLTRVDDSGAIPVSWAADMVLRERWWSLIMTPLVVSPCRPPGFLDHLVEEYLRMFCDAPDIERGELWVMAAQEMDACVFEVDQHRRGKEIGTVYYNKLPNAAMSFAQHWVGSTYWWRAYCNVRDSRHDLSFSPKITMVDPWIDIHIDTEDQWLMAEYWFKKKVLLAQGEDCYERYRDGWLRGRAEEADLRLLHGGRVHHDPE